MIVLLLIFSFLFAKGANECTSDICVLYIWTKNFEERGCVEFYRKYYKNGFIDLNKADVHLKKLQEAVWKKFGKSFRLEEPIVSVPILEHEMSVGFRYFKIKNKTKDFNCKKFGVYGAVVPSSYGRVKVSIYIETQKSYNELPQEERKELAKELGKVRRYLEENLERILGW